ncbi:resolvase domain-containing protein [Candidatus Magnetobacterium bavaricum]|uniref:Resolvase domain-containing protein n=1 Tax=Candidatus Magnetobacterium bavaricum TaxID=29290 RepID=A0A0F3GPI7_9BACT|nr:resolvase domain-containing protein [Candidatus Magnetobacterium bavaricum]
MMMGHNQNKNKIVAYLRVSTGKQDLNNQKLELHEYAYKHNIKIDEFFEIEVSSRKSTKERKIDKLLEYLQEGDLLIVSELSRLGRSVGQVIQIIDALIKASVKFIAVKESIRINGKQDIQTKTMITMFALFAEIERDLISERTKQGLIAAKEKGKMLGRPKGSGTSKLDKFKPEIEALLNNGSTKSFIAKRYKTSLNNLYKWMKKHKIPLKPDGRTQV